MISITSSLANFRPLVPTVGLYILIIYSLSSIIYILATISNRNGGSFRLYSLALMWLPAISALITLKYNGRDIRELKWGWPSARYALMSWYVPIVYSISSYIFVWSTGLGSFPNYEFMEKAVKEVGLGLSPFLSTVIFIALQGSFGMATSMSSALGEEIGWGGFLIPELVKSYGFTTSSLFSGVVWGIWHWPLIITTDAYSSSAPWQYQIVCFTASIVAASVIFSWIRLKSGSLWTGAIIHASHNLYIQVFLSPLTVDTGHTAWFIDEFGCVLAFTIIITAIYFWRRRGELELGLRLTE